MSSVHVTVKHKSAGRAPMGALLKGLLLLVAAGAAFLRGAAWVNPHERPTGALSLVGDLREEDAPRGVLDRTTKAMPLCATPASGHHRDDVLCGDHVVLGDELLRDTVEEVRTGAGYALVMLREGSNGLAPAATPLSAARDAALGARKLLRGAHEVLRRSDLLAVARGDERQQADVDADRGAGRLERLGLHITDEHSEPTVGLADNPQAAYCVAWRNKRPRLPSNTHTAHTKGCCVSANTDVRLEGTVTRCVLEAWIAWCATRLDAAEKRREGAMDAGDHLLGNALQPTVPVERFEFAVLVVCRQGLPAPPPCVAALLYRGVVEFATAVEDLDEARLLRARRVEAEFETPNHGCIFSHDTDIRMEASA